MRRATRPAPTIHGCVTGHENVDWTPLRELVGMDLADWFMAMFQFELEDGAPGWAYKHYLTRRYLHLTEDGRAFVFAGREEERGLYQEIPRSQAIEEAFLNWRQVADPDDDVDFQEHELNRACALADRGETFPYSLAEAATRDTAHRLEREAGERRRGDLAA